MSYDPVEEVQATATEQAPEVDENPLLEPLTRQEREEMKELSNRAYGKSGQWQKMLRKGELRPGTWRASSGQLMEGKILHHFTVNEIKKTMEKIVADRLMKEAMASLEKLKRESDAAAATPT